MVLAELSNNNHLAYFTAYRALEGYVG